MNVSTNVAELLVVALRDAKHQSGVAMMRVAATTAINIRQFDVLTLFERLVTLCDGVQKNAHDRDVLCVALACAFISGQNQAGACYGLRDTLSH